MIPGLDALIVQRIAAIGGDASQAKLQILAQANAAWIARGRPHETMNARIWLSLAVRPPATRVRSITAGQPGYFSPATATIPTFAELQQMHPPRQQINPLSPWPTTDYVIAAGGEPCTWTGFDWVVRPSAYQAAVLGDSPSHYWRLNEQSGLTAGDLVGGANGTISGGVTLKQPGAVSDGYSAMAFNGTTGKIGVGTLTLPAATTLEAWIHAPSTATSYMPIGSSRPGGTFFGVFSRVPQVYAPGGAAFGARIVVDGAWHHLVYVFTGTTALIYVDGTLDSTTALPHGPSTTPAAIGWDAEGALFMLGSLDEIALYPRALTAAQILAHYHAAGR